MKKILKQLKKTAKHTRLSSSEKADMKNMLVRHIQKNPATNEALFNYRSHKSSHILSPIQVNNFRNKKTMPILIILGLLMGGSASFAAELTLPGDTLYPVKIHINEAVRGAVAISPTAKAEWEVHLVERRLEEVKKLTTSSLVDLETQQKAQKNLEEYTLRVEDRIKRFEKEDDKEDALKTSADLSGILKEYEQTFSNLVEAEEISEMQTSSVVTSDPKATSTVVVIKKETEALQEVLYKLSEAKDHAEEKHEELKKKYQKEEDDKSNEDVRSEKHSYEIKDSAPISSVNTNTVSSTVSYKNENDEKDENYDRGESVESLIQETSNNESSTLTTTDRSTTEVISTEHHNDRERSHDEKEEDHDH